MTTCEEFEVAVEMKLHGALAAPQAAALEQHLFSCASCRSFKKLATRTEQTMSLTAAISIDNVNWETMKQHIQQVLNDERRDALKRGGVIAALLAPLMMLVNSQSLTRAVVSALVAIVMVSWVIARRHLRSISTIQGHSSNRAEFLYQYRYYLEDRLRITRFAAFAPVLVFGVVGHGFWSETVTLNLRGYGLIGLAVMMVGVSLYIQFVKRPDLQRQLTAIKN